MKPDEYAYSGGRAASLPMLATPDARSNQCRHSFICAHGTGIS
jgi:hypothetical protein